MLTIRSILKSFYFPNYVFLEAMISMKTLTEFFLASPDFLKLFIQFQVIN